MRTFTSETGAEITYSDAGAGAPLVVLPDSGRNAGDLGPLVAALERIGRCVTVAPASWGEAAADAERLAGLLRAIRAAPATLIGIGDGARVALQLAARRPELVHRVIADHPVSALGDTRSLEMIACHVLVVWGEDDRVTQEAKGRFTLTLARARRVDYACGGPAYATARDRFLADLPAWLRQEAAPARVPMNETRPEPDVRPSPFEV